MPPKQKFTKEEIVAAALRIIREEGKQAVTARKLGEYLGSSARPVFTVFSSMEEVQLETVQAAKALYGEYVQKGLLRENGFLGSGLAYITFAQEEPQLFQLLFMTPNGYVEDVSVALALIDNNSDDIFASVQSQYGMNEEKSRIMYRNLWIFSHGLATLIATGVCSFTQEEAEQMLMQVGGGMVQMLRNKEKSND